MQDLSQDVWLEVFENLCTFRFESQLFTWIRRIATNMTINWRIRSRFMKYMPNDEVEQYIIYQASIQIRYDTPKAALQERLKKSIAALIVEDKILETFKRRYERGQSIREIAAEMNTPSSTIRRRLHSLRQTLKATA